MASTMQGCASPELINARIYHTPSVVRSYTESRLTPMEAVALLRFQPSFRGRDILDIGVGTGRTSRYLAPLAREYLGIDYSPVMVEHLAATLPELPVRQMDMCDLAALGARRFDFVFAPNNVLDAVGHEGRQRALAEWHRVLRPGGVLMFSTHNRGLSDELRRPRLSRVADPLRQLRELARYLRRVRSYHRRARDELQTAEYALLTDSGHDFAVLHYYIEPHLQRRQLETAGFELLEILDAHGSPVPVRAAAPADSPSLMYVARRRAWGG